MLPEEAAFVLVVIPKGGNGAYSEGGEVVSNVVGGEAVADVLHAVAEEQKSGRFFDELVILDQENGGIVSNMDSAGDVSIALRAIADEHDSERFQVRRETGWSRTRDRTRDRR